MNSTLAIDFVQSVRYTQQITLETSKYGLNLDHRLFQREYTGYAYAQYIDVKLLKLLK